MKIRLLLPTTIGRAAALGVLFSVVIVAPAWAGVGGSLDVVSTNFTNSDEVCLNDGLSPPGFSCSSIIDPNIEGAGVALGDMDGDGHLDVVIADVDPVSNRNRVCLNDGLSPPGFSCRDVSTGFTGTGVAVGDIDGDGDLDAIFAGSGFSGVCLNDGLSPPGFSCSNADANAGATDVALGDVDGDGDMDAVFAASGTISQLSNRVCLNDGLSPPGFTCSDVSAALNATKGVALEDLDGDNDLDAVFANSLASEPSEVCLNNGGTPWMGFTCGDFSADANARHRDVAIGDVDGQNGPDVVFASGEEPNRVCLNNGLGPSLLGFTCSDVSTDTNASTGVALGDVDGVNGLDAVFANFAGQLNRICLNNGLSPPGFTCSDVSAVGARSLGVALGDLTTSSLPPIPALSLRGSLIALLLLLVGAAVAGLSRRRSRRVA